MKVIVINKVFNGSRGESIFIETKDGIYIKSCMIAPYQYVYRDFHNGSTILDDSINIKHSHRWHWNRKVKE